MKFIKVIFFLWLIALLVLLLFNVVKSYGALKPTDYISSLAALTIVFLTAAYVFITSRQLETMGSQLKEMKRSREHTSQPLVLVKPLDVYLEKPRLFYNPPEKRYSGGSRLCIGCSVSNLGNSPAVSLDVCACLSIPHKKGDSVEFTTCAEHIDVLPVIHSNASPENISFMFCEDDNAEIINAIRQNIPMEAPILKICAVYKNVLGACFACRQRLQLFYDRDTQDDTLKNWHCQISAFPSMLKREIEQMRRLRKKNEEAWETLFSESKQKYESTLIGEDQKLKPVRVPNSFTTFVISEQKYESIVSKSRYGQFLPGTDVCIVENHQEESSG